MQKRFVGRYPTKAAERILHVIQAAQANAENKGLDVDRLRIFHAAAYPGMKLKRYTPRAHGRAQSKIRNNNTCRNRARREISPRRTVNEHSQTFYHRIN
jgi:ribosomal protein uL22